MLVVEKFFLRFLKVGRLFSSSLFLYPRPLILEPELFGPLPLLFSWVFKLSRILLLDGIRLGGRRFGIGWLFNFL